MSSRHLKNLIKVEEVQYKDSEDPLPFKKQIFEIAIRLSGAPKLPTFKVKLT